MIHFLNTYFVHVLTGNGYAWWSGAGSDLGELTIVGGLVMLYRQRLCHVDKCHRMGHHDPEVHAPACRKHHSHRERRGIIPVAWHHDK